REFTARKVIKHRHPPTVGNRRRTHDRHGAALDFVHELDDGLVGHDALQRGNRAFEHRLVARARPRGIVADVARALDDVLAKPIGGDRLARRLRGSRRAGQFREVGVQDVHIGRLQVRASRHLLPALLDARVEIGFRHGPAYLLERRSLYRRQHRFDLGRRAGALGAVACLAVEPIEVRARDRHTCGDRHRHRFAIACRIARTRTVAPGAAAEARVAIVHAERVQPAPTRDRRHRWIGQRRRHRRHDAAGQDCRPADRSHDALLQPAGARRRISGSAAIQFGKTLEIRTFPDGLARALAIAMPVALTRPDLEADVILRDGSTVRLRATGEADAGAVFDLFGGLSERSLYYRFMTARRIDLEEARRIVATTPEGGADNVLIVAERGAALCGIAGYYRSAEVPDRAEVAFAIADALQGHGLGTRMLERLAEIGRDRGLRAFDAYVLGA